MEPLSGQLGSYVEDVKCHTIVEQRFELVLSWVRSVLFPLTCFFRLHLSLRSHFYPLVFESLKGSVKGSIWSAGKTISIGRLLGSGFAEKNASSTIYGINKLNLLTHKLGN